MSSNLPICFCEEQIGELHKEIYVFDFNIQAWLCVRLPTNEEFANSQRFVLQPWQWHCKICKQKTFLNRVPLHVRYVADFDYCQELVLERRGQNKASTLNQRCKDLGRIYSEEARPRRSRWGGSAIGGLAPKKRKSRGYSPDASAVEYKECHSRQPQIYVMSIGHGCDSKGRDDKWQELCTQ